MPFQKKPVIIDTAGRRRDQDPTSPSHSDTLTAQNDVLLSPGVRPSPLDGKLTVSTGIRSLDSIVAGGHGGLPLGTSLLIEETGTADFGGLLLRYFAAEGLVQGHDIHALGYGEAWKADLPALSDHPQSEAIGTDLTSGQEQMKIAWRYERLGQDSSGLPLPIRPAHINMFCRRFDLSRRLHTKDIKGTFHGYPLDALSDPFGTFISCLVRRIQSSPASSIHRVIIPNFLLPAAYSPSNCLPQVALRFITQLRAILRRHAGRVVVGITYPTVLYPRMSGVTRWVELLSDAVLELAALRQERVQPADGPLFNDHRATFKGLLTIHKLALSQEDGSSSGKTNQAFDCFSFRVSASSGIDIAPFSLPPIKGSDAIVDDMSRAEKHSLDF